MTPELLFDPAFDLQIGLRTPPLHCGACRVELSRFSWAPGTNLCRGCQDELQLAIDALRSVDGEAARGWHWT